MTILEKLDWLMCNLKHLDSEKSREWTEKLYEYYLEHHRLSDKQKEIIDDIYKKNMP